MMPVPRTSILFVLIVCGISGCGGESSKARVRSLTITAGEGFNGNAGEIGGTSRAFVTDSGLTVNTSAGLGGLSLIVSGSGSALKGWHTIDGGGTRSEYLLAGNGFAWRATSGRVYVVKVNGATASLRLVDVAFVADDGVSQNSAAGAFTLSGDLFDVPIAEAGSPTLVFTQLEGTNANLVAFPADSLIQFNDNPGMAQVAVVPPLQPTRLLLLTSFNDLSEGDTLDFGSFGSVGLQYSEQVEGQGQTRIWGANSGFATIVSKQGSALEIRLIGVRFSATGGIGDSATGSFLVSGTFSKR